MSVIDVSAREKRLILRRRATWHNVLRWSWYTLSALVVVIVLFVTAFVFLGAQKKLAYQNSLEAIQAVARSGTQPTFFIPAGQYAQQPMSALTEEAHLASYYIEKVMHTCDSLQLTADKRIGFRFEIVAVPCGLFGKRHVGVRACVYSSSCGCDTDSLIDATDLVLDSVGTNVVVSSSQRKVATAGIQP